MDADSTLDEFAEQAKALYIRAGILYQRTVQFPARQSEVLADSLEELHVAIEELRVTEEELHRQNEELIATRQLVGLERQLYQDLFEFAPDAYLTTDIHGIVQDANQVVTKLLGISQASLIGKPLAVFVAPKDRVSFQRELALRSQGEQSQEWVVRLQPHSGKPFDAAIWIRVVPDNEGRAIALRWLLRDITIRRDAEREVLALNAQLRQRILYEAMLRRITDKVRASLDKNQILQAVVQELVLVLGVVCCDVAIYDLQQETSEIRCWYTVEGVTSPSSQGAVVQMKERAPVYHQLRQHQELQFCELDTDSSRNRGVVLACPIFDNQGVLGDLWLFNHNEHVFDEQEIRLVQQVASQCAIAIRQARLYRESQRQVAELEKLNRLKDDFLSTVSHELRTPITTMKMAIHLLKTATNPEQRQRYFEILQRECDREASLIKDLLDLQQLEASTSLIFLPEVVNLYEWLPTVVESLRSRIQEHQQVLRLDLPESLPSLITDRASLTRVLTELLNNAYKYTPSGGEILFSIRSPNLSLKETNTQDLATTASCGNNLATDLSAQNPKELATITFVLHNQAEIPASELPYLFDKFYRVPNGNPWQHGGTGLGLALVRKLVEKMQGTIQVSSQDEWTTFTVQLPVQMKKQ